jgi:hypothetical protein
MVAESALVDGVGSDISGADSANFFPVNATWLRNLSVHFDNTPSLKTNFPQL